LLIIELKVLPQMESHITGRGVVVQADLFVLHSAPEPAARALILSIAYPLLSMLIWTPAAPSRARYCGLMKWLPWSLFKMRGVARVSARRTATSTKGSSQRLVQFPTDDVAGVPVEDRDQLQPADQQANVGGVDTPDNASIGTALEAAGHYIENL
jgi:hypothetical protein